MRRSTLFLGALAVAVPTTLAALFAKGDGVSASCDEAVLRTLGRGYTGVFHGLDGLVALPFGAHPQWASMGCAGLLGLVVFAAVRPRLSRSLAGVLAFVAAFLATITLPVVRESTLAFGTVLGAALALVPLIQGVPGGVRVAAVALALSCDVPTGVAAGVALASSEWPRRRDVLWALVGVVPILWMLVRRRVSPESSLDVGPLSGWLGDGAQHVPPSEGWRIIHEQLGLFAVTLAIVGVVASWRASRRWTLSAVALFAFGLVGPVLGAPTGPTRYGSSLLAALAVTAMFTASGIASLAEVVARARIPMARTSAALIVVLCLALPARIADDTTLALSSAPPDPTAAWNERVLGGLPRDAVLLLPTPELVRRAKAARAAGALASSVLLVSVHGTSGVGRAIVTEPLLTPVLRDLVLYGAPEELSLSELAAARPVLVAFDARWSRSLAKHLVPEGLFDQYLVEPRGAIEREKTLAAASIDEPTMTAIRKVPTLASATVALLRARVLAARATGERDYVQGATSELLRITPEVPAEPDPARRARGATTVAAR